ncbi:4'-phosphopantetheinyl transferase family protein [Streptomyces sp. CA-181903]|uniref:4'-phosphopantetheinyl transferase family protein n=1 Tax=Streptomyces sp. CA-181903 TaxID=3240055 RepID=UPI003D900D20
MSEAAEGAARLLDDEQRRRAARLKPRQRHRRIFAHAGLRTLLADYLDAAPEELTFRRAPCPSCGGPHGRPYLVGASDLGFSMSHSGDGVLYAVSARAALGADVEATTVANHTLDAVSRWLSAEERQDIAAAAPADHSALFLRYWVRREAYVKAVGTGLAHGLGPAPWALPDGWRHLDIDVPEGYVASVAWHGDTPPVHNGRMPPSRILGSHHKEEQDA